MDELKKQYETALDRKNNPEEGSDTTYLFNKGLEKILKKVYISFFFLYVPNTLCYTLEGYRNDRE